MIKIYLLQKEDLWFRKLFLSDEETMSYNNAWGGTIDFAEDRWNDWYKYWVLDNEGFPNSISNPIKLYKTSILLLLWYKRREFG